MSPYGKSGNTQLGELSVVPNLMSGLQNGVHSWTPLVEAAFWTVQMIDFELYGFAHE